MDIKNLNIEKINEIIEIEKEAFPEIWGKFTYEEMLNNSHYEILGITIDKKLVSYIVLYKLPDIWEIIRIAVDKNYRKQGFADKLIKKAIEKTNLNLILEVRKSNINAINLYLKNNFKQISIRKNYYKDNNEDALIMLYEVETNE